MLHNRRFVNTGRILRVRKWWYNLALNGIREMEKTPQWHKCISTWAYS
jgi:hypothetical protein